jgi:pyruvate formate lyase activating enzyme
VTVWEVIQELEKERLVMEESRGGVTFSGGEPLMQPRFLKDLLKSCREKGFHTAVDTSGFALRSDLESILPLTSLFLFDLKLMDISLHEKFTGSDNQVILDNFRWLTKQGKPVRIRIPLVSGYTATRENMSAISDFLAPYAGAVEQIDLLPYHRIGMQKYDKLGIPCKMPGEEGKLPEDVLFDWKAKFEQTGIKVKIGG